MTSKILAIGLLAILLIAGCTTGQTPNTNSFELNSQFSVSPGQTYTNDSTGLTIKVGSLTDSRCPLGVQCIWAGELGVDLNVSINDTAPLEVHMGQTTREKYVISGYEIELISVSIESNSAVLIVRQASQQQGEKQWFSYDPKQCNSNPWQGDNWPVKRLFRDDEERVRAWLSSVQEIETFGYSSKQTSEVVCLACSCPSGQRIAVLVDSKDSAKMNALGWALVGNENGIACTMDAKICSDGSAVGREAPFCEFAACPAEVEKEWFSIDSKEGQTNAWDNIATTVKCSPECVQKEKMKLWLAQNGVTLIDYDTKEISTTQLRIAVMVSAEFETKMSSLGFTSMEPVACTEEAKLCGDGSYVGRGAPFCEFAACPVPTYLVKVTNVPGFVIEPVTTETTIYADGKVEITKTWGRDGNIVTEYKTISAAKISELKNFIKTSKVFALTEEDARMCIADIPTRSISVNLDGKTAFVYGIGAECEKANIKAAYDLLAKVDATLKTATTTNNVAGAYISIEKIDHPGFVANPKTVTTTIDNKGSFTVKTEQYARSGTDSNVSTYSGKMTRQQLEAIAQFALSTNFFSITEDDTAMCITDVETQSLDITIGSKSHSVSGIGQECDREKLDETRAIIQKIEQAVGCEAGYTYTQEPYLTITPQYYCKINKDWNQFQSCSNTNACGANDWCISQIDNNTDYRCVPQDNYKMDCWCNPSDNNMPACACT